MKNMKKMMALMLALALLVGGIIGGTIAWLTASTDPVTNTFTVGDIDLTLKETELTYNEEGNPVYGELKSDIENDYKLIPGTEYTKDPVVTVTDDSEDCYLFVKVVETNNPANYLTYSYAMDAENSGWTKLDSASSNGTTVWYREVNQEDAGSAKTFYLLTANKVIVKDTIVKTGTNPVPDGMIEMPADSAKPSMVFTAYAVQLDNLSVTEAWEKVSA